MGINKHAIKHDIKKHNIKVGIKTRKITRDRERYTVIKGNSTKKTQQY